MRQYCQCIFYKTRKSQVEEELHALKVNQVLWAYMQPINHGSSETMQNCKTADV